MKKLVFLIACTGLFFVVKAEKVYDYNPVCQQAYREITELKLKNGQLLLAKARLQNPDNLIPLFLESYIDFFTLFLNEDPAEYKSRQSGIEGRLEILKKGPTSSPFYDYCLSETYLHKAVIEIKFSEMWSGAWDIKRAYQYIKENRKKFPHFSPNDFLSGSLQAVTGTIPKGYKWIANLMGLKGSLTEGMKMVRYFANSNDPWARLMSNESAFVYCYLEYYIENKHEEALSFIREKKLDLVDNHLLAYMAANLAKNNKQTELARSIILHKNKSPEYFYTPVWDYEMGFIHLHHLEIQESIESFNRFLTNFRGKFYVKDVYQKLSWCYYLLGNTAAAQNARNNVLKKGSTDTDADKQALREAKSGKWTDPLLIKTRVLSDGGYNNEALILLKSRNYSSFSKEEERLEYVYRMARICDDLNKNSEAIQFYLTTIKSGETSPAYYAHRAALQLGMLYERLGDRPKAIAYYEKCLTIEDSEYKNSLDQKAKSGIARCKGE